MCLSWAKLSHFPVTHTLGLAHTLSKEDGINLLQTSLTNAVATAKLLKLHERSWSKGFASRESGDVITKT